MLEDVERIEVISGPGATLWGANAVNGVINVITRPASATQGAVVGGGGGNLERGGLRTLRRAVGQSNGVSRVRQGNSIEITRSSPTAGLYRDESEIAQVGFRLDSGDVTRSYTVQGDAYRGEIDQAAIGARHPRCATCSDASRSHLAE